MNLPIFTSFRPFTTLSHPVQSDTIREQATRSGVHPAETLLCSARALAEAPRPDETFLFDLTLSGSRTQGTLAWSRVDQKGRHLLVASSRLTLIESNAPSLITEAMAFLATRSARLEVGGIRARQESYPHGPCSRRMQCRHGGLCGLLARWM